MKHQNGEMRPRALLGLALIALAVLLFLNNIGFRLLGIVFSHWPLVAIAAGVYLIVTRQRKDGPKQPLGFMPVALLALGGLGMLTRYGVFHFSIGAVIGPLILLLVGLHLFRPNRGFCRRKQNEDNKMHLMIEAEDAQFTEVEPDQAKTYQNAQEAAKEDNRIDVFTILGGGNYSTRSQTLNNGNVVCIMGGAEIDIRDADTAQGVLELDVLAFMGGVEVKVPAHWQVTIKAIPLLGGVTNKTTCLADKMGVPKKQLVITGLALMGGIEVRN